MGKGKTNKRKGSQAERLYAKLFKELGFNHCVTSRYGSRIHDDSGIDLINLPFNVQIKAGYARGLNIKEVIDYTKNKIKELFPSKSPEHQYPTIVIHRKDVGRGGRRKDTDDLVYMSFEDFKQIIKMIKWE